MIDRRELLAACAGLGAAVVGAADGAIPTSEKLRTFMLMRGALDDRLVIGTISGRYYGVVDGDTQPLFGVIAAVFSRFRTNGDGYEGVSVEQAYFTDLGTGQVLGEWHNPYTGESVSVPATQGRPAKVFISHDLKFAPAEAMPGSTLVSNVVGPTVIDGDLWMGEENFFTFVVPGQDRPFHYGEINGLQASLADLGQPRIKRVRARTTYTSIVSWRAWMKMGDRTGHLIGTGQGAAGITANALPAAWREATERLRPELLHDPLAILAPLWTAKAAT